MPPRSKSLLFPPEEDYLSEEAHITATGYSLLGSTFVENQDVRSRMRL